jgi:hypothetical protein
VVPEEQHVHADDDGYQHQHVQHDRYLSPHRLVAAQVANPTAVRGVSAWSTLWALLNLEVDHWREDRSGPCSWRFWSRDAAGQLG